ncbi:MAG: response regulator transcription factor [Gemmataceae bacterium]|jgi:two-component system OmpR family response regulator/two-component system copper resistance phosphate regulon response regulator CusR
MEFLLIEDDPLIGKSLKKGLNEAGHECFWAREGMLGLEKALGQQFDAIIMDIMLPGKNGIEILTEIRGKGIKTPVLLLTALGSVEERVSGLKAGADDYLVKPFALQELLARLDAICRRSVTKPAMVLVSGDLKLDLTTRKLSVSEKEIMLTPTEFSVLELLIRHAGQVVPRKMICEHIWDSDWEGTTNVIEVHINRLRNKLKKGGTESTLETVRGRGYVLLSNR